MILRMRQATRREQRYLDRAAYYTKRAILCREQELWPEAETNYGSAMESLLRVRYGGNGKLANLVAKFDADTLFEAISVYHGGVKQCVTCMAEKVRKLRNAVHPDCWKETTEADVQEAQTAVVMLHHALVTCSSRIADFHASPDTDLASMDRSGAAPLSDSSR